jgi:hypothetical protein
MDMGHSFHPIVIIQAIFIAEACAILRPEQHGSAAYPIIADNADKSPTGLSPIITRMDKGFEY